MQHRALFILLLTGCSFSAAAQWTAIPLGTTADIKALHFFDPWNGLCSGTGMAQFVTRDGGATWDSTQTTNIRAYDFLDAHTGYAVGGGTTGIRKTTDGGHSWTDVTYPAGTFPPDQVSVIDAQTAFFAAYGGTLTKTIDGATTVLWPDIPTYGTVYGLSFTSTETGIALTHTGIHTTLNGGFNWWGAFYLDPDGSMNALCRVDEQTVYVSGTSAVYKTTDGGLSWTKLPVGGPTVSYRGIDFYDADHGMIAGSTGTIAYTADGGITWEIQPSGVTEHLRNVRMLGPVSAIVVGDGGTLLKNVFDQPPVAALPYPNPVTDQLTVQAEGLQYAVIYDASGKQVMRASPAAGDDTLVLHCPELAAGIYQLAVTSAAGTTNQKIVKK